MTKFGVLLINLGSPDSPSVPDVRRYLREFLGDKRVLDLPAPARWGLLEGIILRTRPGKSAHAYASVWTAEGSPLIRTSRRVAQKLADSLDSQAGIYLAMRYGRPSIPEVVAQLASDGVTDLLIFPQYAHYAMSSWETVVVRAEETLTQLAPHIRVTCVQPFHGDEDYVEALYEVSAPYLAQPHDHLLFSYHGLPVRHLRKADTSGAHCMRSADCCNRCAPAHATCYRAQVFGTTRAFAERAGLAAGSYSVAFQSRLAGEPWLEPFTDRTLRELPGRGVRRLLVLCPAFVADCLETLEEISGEGKAAFLGAGGDSFQQIPCLNDQDPYIRFLGGRVQAWLVAARPAACPPKCAQHSTIPAAIYGTGSTRLAS